MRKHNEGYALPFVLVVMTVLALVATSMMTLALRNLQNQRTSVERMQDRYAAEGEIEKVVAKLRSETEFNELDADRLVAVYCGGTGASLDAWDDSQYEESGILTFTLTSKSGTVQVDCQLKINGTISEGASEKYNVSSPVITYEKYQISTIPEGGESDETLP